MTDRFTIAYFNFLTLPKHRDAASECVNAIILKKMKADKKLALIQALNLEQVFQNVDVTVRPLFLPPRPLSCSSQHSFSSRIIRKRWRPW